MFSDKPEEVLSLFFGPKSNALGASFIALEAAQMFEFEDPVDHSIIFKDPAEKAPRALFFQDSSSFDLLEYLNPSSFEKDSQIAALWNPEKTKVFNQKNEENQEFSLKNLIFSKFRINRNKLLPLPNFFTSKFLEFFQGNEATKCPEHVENISEILRKSLEESDYINGFHVLCDCDSGFGSYSHFTLEILREESPKTPVFMVPINEPLQQSKNLTDIQTLNQLFTLSSFREADLVLPLDFSEVMEELRTVFTIPKQNDVYYKSLLIAPLLSNATLGFRLKNERDSMRDYLNKLIYFPNMNIFNLAATIPRINEKGEISSNNIFKFKENKGNFAFFNCFSNKKQCQIDKDDISFSEGYILRGLSKEEKFLSKPNAYKYNIKGIEAVLSFEDKKMRPEVSKKIADCYEGGTEEAWPLHSCLFTNDMVKEGMKELMEKYKGIGTDLKQAFIEDEDFANDAFKEMLNNISCICDNYDKKN